MEYLIPPFEYPKECKKRFGNNYDGGYVTILPNNTLNNSDASKVSNNAWDLYISAGVGYEESFSYDFIKFFNLPKNSCWAFDGTITKYPGNYTQTNVRPHCGKLTRHSTPQCGKDTVWFVNKNIGPEMSETTVNLFRLIASHFNIFLKMDIEGSEYDWFLCLEREQMQKFREIVVEFHDIHTTEKVADVFKKMRETHIPVHLHGNNFGGSDVETGIPNVMEVTYIRKNDIVFIQEQSEKSEADKKEQSEENNEEKITLEASSYLSNPVKVIIPIDGLDYPNNKDIPDILFSF